jgi:hypothetical protein
VPEASVIKIPIIAVVIIRLQIASSTLAGEQSNVNYDGRAHVCVDGSSNYDPALSAVVLTVSESVDDSPELDYCTMTPAFARSPRIMLMTNQASGLT